MGAKSSERLQMEIKAALVILALYALISSVSATNLQPVSVTYNETFYDVNITVRNSTGTIVWSQLFLSPTAKTAFMGYVEGYTSTYSELYNFTARVNLTSGGWREIYNNTLGYLGRGPVVVGDIPTAIVSNGDTTHIPTSSHVYNFVTSQGYITSGQVPTYETDPKISSLSSNKWCWSSDAAHISCDRSIPLTAESDPVYSGSAAAGITSGLITNWNYAFSNLTDSWNKIGQLWTNASNQDGRIITLEGYNHAAQPNINWANITTGTAPKLLVDASNITTGTIANALYNLTYLGILYQAAGSYITTTAPQDNNITNLWTNASAQQSAIADLYTNASVQQGYFTSLWTNATDQQTHITNLWSNASTQSAQQVSLWSNASNTVGRVITLEGRPLQPLIDGANITTGNIVAPTGKNMSVSSTGSYNLGTLGCFRQYNTTHAVMEVPCTLGV
jgi:hypothetical protein